jgi:outer membrane protein
MGRANRLRLACSLGLAAVLAAGAPVRAQSLNDALARAYENNPAILAARAQLRGTDELVQQAKSNWWRPTVTLNAQAAKNVNSTRSYQEGDVNTLQATFAGTLNNSNQTNGYDRRAGLDVNLPLWRGGQTEAAIRNAESSVGAQRGSLADVEQQVLGDVVEAYANVLLYGRLRRIQETELGELRALLRATEEMLRAQRRTITDVALVQTEIAQAEIAASNTRVQLRAAESRFEALVGTPPAALEERPRLPESPANLDDTLRMAAAEHPTVLAAAKRVEANEATVRQRVGALMPQLSAFMNASRDYNHYRNRMTGGTNAEFHSRDDTTNLVAGFRMTMPIYQGGADWSGIRQAKQALSQSEAQLMQTKAGVADRARAVWEERIEAGRRVSVADTQREAAERALDGVRRQLASGTMTMQDLLDARRRWSSALTTQEQARTDHFIAGARLNAAIGRLNARALGLAVPLYDPGAYGKDVEDLPFGIGIN